jgi:hypothetical protein
MDQSNAVRPPSTRLGSKVKQAVESRKGRRRKVYLGELTSTEIRLETGELSCEIVDLSPRGVGVVAELNTGAHPPERGTRVHVSYVTKGGQRFRSWGVVTSCDEVLIRNTAKLRIGIAYVETEPINEAEVQTLQAAGHRIPTPDGFTPVGYCEDPFFFRERIHCQVEYFSPLGMTLRVFGFHATLLPNVVLPLSIFLPMLGQVEVEVRLVSVNESRGTAEQCYQVEVVFSKGQDAFRHAISEYLLLSRAVPSVDRLKEMGFPVAAIDRALSFRYANSAEDYETLMLLRGSPLDRFDDFSRHILCSVGDKVIACARLVFTDGEPVRSEYHCLLGGIQAKYWLQRFLEASKFHCLEGFSARDVYFAFLKQFVRICAESNSRYLMTTCSSKAIRLYEKIGFRQMKPMDEEHGPPGGTMVVVLDVHRLLAEKGLVEASVWRHLYADVAKHVGVIEKQKSAEKKPLHALKSPVD